MYQNLPYFSLQIWVGLSTEFESPDFLIVVLGFLSWNASFGNFYDSNVLMVMVVVVDLLQDHPASVVVAVP
jgi:hypothetical protein